ncbi:MAG: hypothetical protein RIS35_2874 [Pseudomonadota bacterium]
MNPPAAERPLRSAGRIFGTGAALFLLAFAALMGWVAMDHYRVRAAAVAVVSRTLPQSLERLRLVRNLEALRLEGFRAVNSPTEDARLQARFVVEVIAGTPAVLLDPESALLAGQVVTFVRRNASDPPGNAEVAREWDRLSRSVAMIADRVTVEGMAGIIADAERMEARIRHGNYKLFGATAIAVMSMIGFLVMIRRIFVRPLAKIEAILAGLGAGREPPVLPATGTREIAAINRATLALHTGMLENERIRAGLEALATTDALTQLSNRRHFMAEASTALAMAHRHRRAVTVAMADIDHFKRVNDEYGHAVGDTVLVEVGAVFRAALRETDLCCRYGGEEFAFLFPETSTEEARLLTDRLRAAVERLDFSSDSPQGRAAPGPPPEGVKEAWGGPALPSDSPQGRAAPGPSVSISIGLADASLLGLEAALGVADDALYRAKRSGRNRVEDGSGSPNPGA